MEIVQQRMELMSGEIEQMRRIKIFTDMHCNQILKTRKQFEYKINGASKNCKKQDFLDYIEYEKKILEALKHRRNSLNIGEKIGDIEHKIINRIKNLFETVLQHFKDDTNLWLTYFKFCKQVNYVNVASTAISNMLKNHSHDVEMWQVAAQWYGYDRKDMSTALKIICKGLAKHKGSKVLYMELIQLEVNNALNNNWSLKEHKGEFTDPQKLWLNKLCGYVKEMMDDIDDCDYYVELLDYLGEYNFTMNVQKKVIEYLVEKYPSKAVTWHMLAQRDLKGLAVPTDTDPLVPSAKTKLSKCIARYKEGLKHVLLDERKLLWSLFLNCVIDARQDHPVALNFKTTSLREALEQAHKEEYLSEKYYIEWVKLVDDKEKLDVIQKAIAKIPGSVELWKLYLYIYVQQDNREGVLKVFKAALAALNDKALPLWTGVLRYYLLSTDDESIIEVIYEEGVKQVAEISDVLKPQFLEWLAVFKGMKYTRQRYLEIAKQEPYCKELHTTMSKLESTEIEFNFEAWDKVHELACDQFGKEDVEVWLNRIQYYTDFNKGRVSKETLQKVYLQAQLSLPTVLFVNFEEKYYAMTNKR